MFSLNKFFRKNTRSQKSATFEIYYDFKLRNVMRKHLGNKRRDWIMKRRKKQKWTEWQMMITTKRITILYGFYKLYRHCIIKQCKTEGNV